MLRSYNTVVDEGVIALSKTIGILGGMGAMATVDLFHKIVEMTYSQSDSGHLHIIVDNNTLIPDRTQAILHNGPSPLPQMVRSAISLERSGADILIMGCNTAHYYYRDICRFVCVPFLNMIKETAKDVRRRTYNRVGLLATDGILKLFFPVYIRHQPVSIYVALARFWMDRDALDIEKRGEAEVQRELEGWMESLSEEQVDDDKTMVILVDSEASVTLQPAAYYQEPDWTALIQAYREEWEREAYPHLYQKQGGGQVAGPSGKS